MPLRFPINDSVGRGGSNFLPDVVTIKTLLNANMPAPLLGLTLKWRLRLADGRGHRGLSAGPHADVRSDGPHRPVRRHPPVPKPNCFFRGGEAGHGTKWHR